MTTPAPPRQRWLDYLPAISLAVVLAGGAQAGGGIIAQMKDNTRRVERLEMDKREDEKARADEAAARAEMLQKLLDRTARIEVKLELMVPTQEKSR